MFLLFEIFKGNFKPWYRGYFQIFLFKFDYEINFNIKKCTTFFKLFMVGLVKWMILNKICLNSLIWGRMLAL